MAKRSKTTKKQENNTGNLGFESTLWAGADKLKLGRTVGGQTYSHSIPDKGNMTKGSSSRYSSEETSFLRGNSDGT